MIIARAPFRVTFGSGVVDVIGKSSGRPVSVISATIDKYVYATLHRRVDRRVVAGYAQRETTDSVGDLKNRLVGAALARCSVSHGIEAHFVSELPIDASGLGGSAAAICALLKAGHVLSHLELAPSMLAREAASVERDDLTRPVGCQDHWASAHGGLNRIEFVDGPSCNARIFPLGYGMLTFLTSLVVLIPAMNSDTRDSDEILRKQTEQAPLDAATRLSDLSDLIYDALASERVDRLCAAMREAWRIKRALSSDTSSLVADAIISEAERVGGAAKLCGAGRSGYVLAVLPTVDAVRTSILAYPGAFVVKFGWRGAEVVWNSHDFVDPEHI